jgi:hypothetical protein
MRASEMRAWGLRLGLCTFLALLSGCGGGGDGPTEPEPGDVGIRFDAATNTWWGTNDWIEYRVGTLPLVFSAGHGGSLEPAEIPDRSGPGIVTVRDSRTIETTLAAADAVEALVGGRPHVIISHLRRTKLDPNRGLSEAALGNPLAERAWAEYHGFIDSAKVAVTAANGTGLYLDMHGHGHEIDRLELGYLLTRSDLFYRADSIMDRDDGAGTSLRALAERTDEPFSAILRGPESFGGLLEARGVPAVPAPRWPSPQLDEPFFSGGYSTLRHGSAEGGSIDGIQIEHHWPGIRDNASNRAAYASALAEVIRIWLDRWY